MQFVFLVNPKVHQRQINVSRQRHATHEVIAVSSDRYFGSCEENIERVVDFVDELADAILIVGEHDYLDWPEIITALGFFRDNNLDALAINIKCCQKQERGGMFALDALVLAQDNKDALLNSLFHGVTLDSRLGFGALISSMGPIDWAAYIGSHIYSRETLRRMFMYKFSEHVYSFVFRQLRLFTSSSYRYGLYPGTPVHRISNDFMQMNQGTHAWGWLENHRTVRGASPCFWIANLQYLNELNDPTLFRLVTYSNCFSILPAPWGIAAYSRQVFLRHCLKWTISVLNHRLSGRSHYLPDSAT